MSQSASLELKPFGIRILLIEPSAFRTNFLAADASSYVETSPVYASTVTSQTLQRFKDSHGKTPGDVEKGTKLMFECVLGQGPFAGKEEFLRLPLGKDAFNRAIQQADNVKSNVLAMEEITKSADYD